MAGLVRDRRFETTFIVAPVGGGWLCEYITASPGKIASGGIFLSSSLSLPPPLFLYSRCLHSILPPTLRCRAFALPFIGISNHRGIPSTYQRCSSARGGVRENAPSFVKVARSFLSIPSIPTCCDTWSGAYVFSPFFSLLLFSLSLG